MNQNDQSYEAVLEQLENGYKKSKNDVSSSSEKVLLALSDSDIYTLRTICTRNIERVEKLSDDSKDILEQTKAKYDNRYRQLVWKVQGQFSTFKMFKGYSELLRAFPLLRTNYICDKLNADVAVTYEYEYASFPIVDISGWDAKRQVLKLMNVAGAESRRVYNPENSPILRVQAFVLKSDLLAVIVSFIPSLADHISRMFLKQYVFKDMEISDNTYSMFNYVTREISIDARKKNIDYWKNLAAGVGMDLMLPGERKAEDNASGVLCSKYKQLDDEIYNSLNIYSHQHKVKKKSVLLYVWSVLLGAYHNQKQMALNIVGSYNEPACFPVFVDNSESMEMSISRIEKQWVNAEDKYYLESEDYDEIFTPAYFDKFHFQHHFMDVEAMVERGDIIDFSFNQGSGNIALTIDYDMFKDNCRMNYIYSSGSFVDENIENLHGLFEHFLKQVLWGKSDDFDLNKYIADSMNYEEKKQKVATARRAVAFRETGLFDICNAKELIDLAEKAIQQSLVVDDEVVGAGCPVNAVGIIADGMVEEYMTDKNGYVKSLRVLSKGKICGLEALLSNNMATNTFAVASENASIIWLTKEHLLELLNRKPDLWRSFLLYEHELLGKTQRIWALE